MEKIVYSWIPGNIAKLDDDLVNKCSFLYSNHYGEWSKKAKNKGRVKLTADRIKEWIENPNSAIYYAKIENELIGYAIAIQLKVQNYGTVSWVTQLVVHSDFRNKGIAKNLLYTIWGLTDHFAWGICSANPYAIRALEKATRRRSIPERIKKNERKLKKIGYENLPYINKNTEIVINEKKSIIDTKFFVSHDDVKQKIDKVTTDDSPWLLGDLNEGEEWFAFTFNDQKQIQLEKCEVDAMLKASDDIAREAYSRMDLDSNKQNWLKHTEKEIRFILNYFNLNSTKIVYDFGCGTGRHLLQLANYGIKGVGVDYVTKNIETAKKSSNNKNIKFINEDCRNLVLNEKADLILCLYDVIGSYVDNRENNKILMNIHKHLKKGGIACISVMNYYLTESIAKHKFVLSKEANKLLDIKPSQIMKETGNIFDPDYYFLDTETHIVYRKEQFLEQKELPKELIVRDRRFTLEEIREMCENSGLKVIESRYVNAADWTKPLEKYDKKAKEILLICTK